MELMLKTQYSDKITFCSFWLAGRLCGVNILDVKEINMQLSITRIHHAPPEVLGYVNIRGQIYLVGDMRLLMGFEKGEITKESRLIIFKDSALESFAVLVDKIGDVVTAEPEQLVDRRGNDEYSGDEIKKNRKDLFKIGAGVCKLENELMVVINSANLLKRISNYFKERA